MIGIVQDNSADICTRPASVFTALPSRTESLNWMVTDVSGWDSIFDRYETVRGKGYFFITGSVFLKIMRENRLATLNWGVISGFSPDIPLQKILEEPLPFTDRNKDLWKLPVSPMNSLACFEVFVYELTTLVVKSDNESDIETLKKLFSKAADLEKYSEKQESPAPVSRKKAISDSSNKPEDEEEKGGFWKRLFGKKD